MAEIYPLGKNRIFYRTVTSPTPIKVTADLIDSELNIQSGVELTKVETVPGLFYFETFFSKSGTYMATFYEDGRERISQAWSTRRIPTKGFMSFLGNNVINI